MVSSIFKLPAQVEVLFYPLHGQNNALAAIQGPPSSLQEPISELLLAKQIAFLRKLGCILQKISIKNFSDEHFNAMRMP